MDYFRSLVSKALEHSVCPVSSAAMIQRRNSKRFILSELKSDDEKEEERICISEDKEKCEGEEKTVEEAVNVEPASTKDACHYMDAPPTLHEILRWKSIKSLKSQLS